MEIIKRSGQIEAFTSEKIRVAMAAAFENPDADTAVLDTMTGEIVVWAEGVVASGVPITVEAVQDVVERTLVAHNRYDEAKRFILYRDGRAKLRMARDAVLERFPRDDGQSGQSPEVQSPEGDSLAGTLNRTLKEIQADFTEAEYGLDHLAQKFLSFVTEGMDADAALAALIRAAVELTTQEAPRWEYIAARLEFTRFYRSLRSESDRRGWDGFGTKISALAAEGLYGEYIPLAYSVEEIESFASLIDVSRDRLLTWSALDLLLKRYVIRTRDHRAVESPQEMFLGIAMHLAMNERADRARWVGRFYDILSRLEVTVATPTLSNARKPFHQLSSCFIDTVPDSLDGIYRSIDNFAQVSKYGGGMGMYFGKVRAVGGPIRGFQGVAGGVLRWIKLANDTAVAVDQLGMRQGSVAVWLDAWHRDLPEFLQIKTNNGDDRMKAHDVFPGVCYPDLFWRLARDEIEAQWHMMCPHEILTVKGWALEDFWGEEWEKRYLECVADPRIAKRTIPVKEIVRLILKSAVETGTPFAFYRDAVNRMNPNSHAGIVYCSNLCTEIAQNMSPVELVSREAVTDNGETVVVETTRPGDFVTCNLASVALGNVDLDAEGELERVVSTVVRMLDDVIDLNYYPLHYAEITNRKYRPIGLGVSGYHHMLAKRGIKWESEAHLAFADSLFERINRAAIGASADLAGEKGAYGVFEGSDWHTGAYFDKRGYSGREWDSLRDRVAKTGMRNAYLIAIAPTSSTSIIAGTTAGIDPIMKRFFLEEKKGSIVPRVAPDLSMKTFWYYKNAHLIDQEWSIRAAGARQRHIDQAQSINLYITTDFSLRQVLNLYLRAWEEGVKSVYYVRSQALEVTECETCAS